MGHTLQIYWFHNGRKNQSFWVITQWHAIKIESFYPIFINTFKTMCVIHYIDYWFNNNNETMIILDLAETRCCYFIFIYVQSNINRYVNKNYGLRDKEELPILQKLIEQKLWNIHPIISFILCFKQYSWQMAHKKFYGGNECCIWGIQLSICSEMIIKSVQITI